MTWRIDYGGKQEANQNAQTSRREMMWGLDHGVSILIDMVPLGCALDEESRLCEGWRKETVMTFWFGA